jgi:hypothetical protein
MAQRRDDRSDLDDVKALAAKARSETGGPVLRRPNPAELSGVRPRRDSVIGMRLTPPPRAAGGGLQNLFWGVLGCLSVLLVGFVALFFLGRSGKLGALLGETAALVPGAASATTAPPPPPAPAPELKEPEAPAAMGRPEHAGRPEHHAHALAAAVHASGAAEHTAPAEPPVAAAPAEEPAAPAPADDPAAKRAVRAPASKPRAEAPAAADDDGAGEAPEAKAESKTVAAKPTRGAAAAPKAAAAAADDTDDDQSAPGQDDVERALDALATRVRGCFVKYQIKGTARVRLVATPAGKAESVNVTGDFEDTPTGLCVESIVSEAKLPAFKGPPLKLSQSYQLR